MRAGRRRVRLTHADKVLFPADGITKADLAAYYAGGRAGHGPARPRPPAQPVALERRHRRATGSSSRRSRRARRSGSAASRCRAGAGGTVCHAVGGETGDARLAGQPELHHAARLDEPRRPPRPPRPAGLRPRPAGRRRRPLRAHPRGRARPRRAAARAGPRAVRHDVAARAASTSSPRCGADREADTVRARAGEIAVALAARRPDELTTEWRKVKRGGPRPRRRARNTYGQTAVAPYAVRARPARRWRRRSLGGARRPGALPRGGGRSPACPSGCRARRPVGGHRAARRAPLPGPLAPAQ